MALDTRAEIAKTGEESELDDYQHLLEDYSHLAPPSRHEVIEGRVLKVSGDDVFIDFGYKSDGIAPRAHFKTPVRAGDLVPVVLEPGYHPEGYAKLSHERATRLKTWDSLEKAMQTATTVTGVVKAKVQGGLAVDIGVEAFLPGSQVDIRPVRNLDQFVGQTIPVKVVKLNHRRGNAVVSRRLAVEQDSLNRKAHVLATIAVDSIVTGVVRGVAEYGAFVDLGGLEGLLHVTDISHARIGHPSEVLHAGDEITVKVLKFDQAKERISLGLKQLQPDPWDGLPGRLEVSSKVTGRVVTVTDYGAFVEIEPGIEGLIHISEMSWSRRMKHPSKVVKPGDAVETVILGVDLKERRISLGLKQLEPNPWTTVARRYAVGSVVEGRVRNLADFGAFIEIEDGIDGLVHLTDLTWSKAVKHPSEILRKGATVQAVILAIDAAHERLSLGIKQLQPDSWEVFFDGHNVNDMVRGKVLRLSNFGAFVDVGDGVEALCHFSEVPGWSGRKNDKPEIKAGEEKLFRIVKMNEEEKRIGLSLLDIA